MNNKTVTKKKEKKPVGPEKVVKMMKQVLKETTPVLDLRRRPHEAMQELKSRQTQNYNDRLRNLMQRENKLVKEGNQEALAQVRQARRTYAREQRRFNLTYEQVWVLFRAVFERWEKAQ